MVVQGDCQCSLNMGEIPNDHLNPKGIATEAIPTYIQTQSQKSDASQLQILYHTQSWQSYCRQTKTV